MDDESKLGINEEAKTSQAPQPPKEETQKSRRSRLQRAKDLIDRRSQAAKAARATGSYLAESAKSVRGASAEGYRAVKKNLADAGTQTVRSLGEPGTQQYDTIRKYEMQNPTPDQKPTDASQAEPYSVFKDVARNVASSVKDRVSSSEFFNPDRSKLATPDLGKHIAERNQSPTWENHILDKKDIDSPLVQIKNLVGKIIPFQKITEFGKSLFSRKDQTPPKTQKPLEPTPNTPPTNQPAT